MKYGLIETLDSFIKQKEDNKMNKKITTSVETITPEMAKEFLCMSNKNRSISSINLSNIKKSIIDGCWQLNGDSIRIDYNGNLIDGQHRLTAIYETGISCMSLIVKGLDPKSFITIDQGKKRTLGDILSVNDVKNHKAAAAVSLILYKYQNLNARNDGSNKPAKEELVEYYEKNCDEIQEAVRFSLKNKALSKLVGNSYLAFIYVILNRSDKDKASIFFDDLITGDGKSLSNQPTVIRNSLIIAATQKTNKLLGYQKAAIVVTGWNNYILNKKNRSIKISKIFENSSKFPSVL